MTAVQDAVPAHVPAHLVQDFDFFFEATTEQAFVKWTSLHDAGKPEIFWTPRNGGHWIVTRADDVEEVYRNHDLFHNSPRGNAIPFRESPAPPLPIASDPPQHGEYRRILAPFFSPKRISEVEARARDIAREVIDSFHADGGCEFYSQFSMHMPIRVFLDIAGLPMSDWPMILPWAQTLVRESDMAVAASVGRDAWAYLGEQITRRRREPGNDPLTALVQGEVFGRKLTDDECVGSAMNVLFAGVDTVPATLSFIAQFLATHPDVRRQLLAQPQLIPKAVEEFLRRFPAPVTGRAVRHDFRYRDVEMKSGDPVLSPVILGNLDERRFPDPLRVDFSRDGLNRSLSFGGGAHRCMGAMLARMQIRVFMEEWLARIPDFGLAHTEEPLVRCGTVMAVVRLPLRW